MSKLEFASIVVICLTLIAGALLVGKGPASCAVSCINADWKWSTNPNSYGDHTYYCSCQKVTP